jgi:hypothetical protein
MIVVIFGGSRILMARQMRMNDCFAVIHGVYVEVEGVV